MEKAVLVIDLGGQGSSVFNEIMDVLKRHHGIEYLQMEEPTVSIPGLEICHDRRKIYRNRKEINLTAKEYDILSLLMANKGRVLTYGQIYEKVWGETGIGCESNAIGCHIRHLREKLYEAEPDAPFTIRCVREVGYCFEVNIERSNT